MLLPLLLNAASIIVASMMVAIGLDLIDYRVDNAPKFLNRFLTVLVAPWVFLVTIFEFLYVLIVTFDIKQAWEDSFVDFWFDLLEALKSGR